MKHKARTSEEERTMCFEEFCQLLDLREQNDPLVSYSDEERNFLWNEIAYKAKDVQDAVFRWVRTGKETDLVIPELKLPIDFWKRPLDADVKNVSMKAVSSRSLIESHDMNYIAAAFTIDWIRREPLEAIMALRRGMR